MKKILLLSDTHNYLDEAIIRHARESDEIWHGGDLGTLNIFDQLNAIKPTRAVYGNIDDHRTRLVCPEFLSFTSEGLRVLILHIGGYPGRYTPRAKLLLNEHTPHLFISGHSHILRVMRDPSKNLLHINPGAAGIHGFHKMRTMMRFKVAEGKVVEPEVIELGLRGSLPQAVS